MATIKSDTYGKTRVRLIYVDRRHEPHQVHELSVTILFEGSFDAVYKNGDNESVLPTDTMKNTVYVLARKLDWDSIEVFAKGIANHFLERLLHVSQVIVKIEQVPWQQIAGHLAAFSHPGKERRTAIIRATRSQVHLTAGITGLQILKTSDSAFAGFMRDEFTTLPETHDRLFGTVLEADWEYAQQDIALNDVHRKIRTVMLNCFAEHKSRSVQHTLFAMGQAVLDKIETVAEIHLVMPNKHCILVDLSRFGLDNPNQLFMPIDEPSGYIEARLVR